MPFFGKKKKEVEEKTPQQERRAAVEDLMEKYKEKLQEELALPAEELTGESKPISSIEYRHFKEEYMPKPLSIYEKGCQFSEKMLKISPDKRKIPDYLEAIEITHLDVTPSGVISFATLIPLVIIVLGSLVSYFILQSTFFILFFVIIGLSIMFPLSRLPMYLANSWRMKASNQMVLCIFYVVTYMRHTSNLERAIEFASDHLAPPLSLDMKKVLWNVETGKFQTVKESLDMYLNTWRKWNLEFIEAFHLVESSLYEGSEERRVGMLDKALTTILEETYEKMLHYAQDLKSPMTLLYMLGIILPILGLVILPLVVSFMCSVKWYHLAALFDVALPIGVYYLGKSILSKRPTGYGDTDIAETNPRLKKYRNILIHVGGAEIRIQPAFIAAFIAGLFFLIGFSPLLIHLVSDKWDFALTERMEPKVIYTMTDQDAQYYFLEYRQSKGCPPGEGPELGKIIGPFGLGASVASLFIVFGIAALFGLYFKFRSQNVIEIREKAKALEQEFAAALFQLGNRLGDGLPAEIAFGKVAEVMAGTQSGKFFDIVSSNVSRGGMSVEDAIFDKSKGALAYFPSSVIESSMKVLVTSVKKGPLIAAQALLNVSRYIKEIHRVNERLKDLLSDTISSMTSQIKFLTPAISGIVIGLTSMITTILGKLGTQLTKLQSAETGNTADITTLFGDGVPTFYFQVVVGIYVIQIVYILTLLVNGIENGEDKLNERYMLGKNLLRSTLIYVGVSLAVILLFNLIAGSILSSVKTI